MSGFLGMFVGGTGVPSAPTIGTATAGNGQATVTFTAPASDGGSQILDYRVTSSPGGVTATGSGSPITITGLSNGTAYTFTVQARNANGYSLSSTSSNQITPVVPPITASGGQTIYDGTGSYTGYRFHIFTSPGTFTVTSNDGNLGFASLIVGGGGSGSNGPPSSGGGGGGGGQVTNVTGISLTTNTAYPITVGPGGSGSSFPVKDGSPSSWAGGSASGGAGAPAPNGATTGNGASSGSGFGGGVVNRPGLEPSALFMGGGGGGGAGANGNDSRYWYPPGIGVPGYAPKGYPPGPPYPPPGRYNGGGGIGVISSIDGTQYGGGGGGGTSGSGTNGYTPESNPGDFGPYGGGGSDSSGAGSKGGGGGGLTQGTGGPSTRTNGGSGIVVIRYPYP
jgi:hypothetical protein